MFDFFHLSLKELRTTIVLERLRQELPKPIVVIDAAIGDDDLVDYFAQIAGILMFDLSPCVDRLSKLSEFELQVSKLDRGPRAVRVDFQRAQDLLSRQIIVLLFQGYFGEFTIVLRNDWRNVLFGVLLQPAGRSYRILPLFFLFVELGEIT